MNTNEIILVMINLQIYVYISQYVYILEKLISLLDFMQIKNDFEKEKLLYLQKKLYICKN